MQLTVDGTRLAYTDQGRGLPLVFIHGFPLSRGCWTPQIEGLSGSCRTIAVDLRGFGGSEAPGGAMSMDRYADDVAALLEALGTGPAVVVGHSMGGYVALAFARRHPELMKGLVMVASRAGADTAAAAEGRRSVAASVQAEGPDGVIEAMTAKMLVPGNTDKKALAAVRAFMEPSSPEGVVAALHAMAERPDSTPDLAGIVAPTFAVTGDEDVVIDPAESQTIADAVPHGTLQVIPDAGHLVAWEQAEAFSRELEGWLFETGLSGGG